MRYLIPLFSFRFCENRREINTEVIFCLETNLFDQITLLYMCIVLFFFLRRLHFSCLCTCIYGVVITSFWSRCEFFNNSFKNLIRIRHKNNRASLMFASSIVLPDWLSMALLCKHWIWQDFKISSLDMKQYPSPVI